MADGITWDKPSYKPGDKATVTVVLAARTSTKKFDFTTAVGNLTSTTTVTAEGSPSITPTAPISKVSDDGVTAVFTVQF